ncbi:MAG: hypothetical protein ACYDDU_10005 [Dermatophilaceae bacterium]
MTEVHFSIIQRKALFPNDFTDLDMVEQRLARFDDRHNAATKPFKWKVSTTDQDDLLDLLDTPDLLYTPTLLDTPDDAQPRAA